MKAPTPAELATFARAIGWEVSLDQKRTDDGRLMPDSWSHREIEGIYRHWKRWERYIEDAHATFTEDERFFNEPLTYLSLAEVRKKLGGSKVETVKDYFITVFSGRYGSVEEVDRMWADKVERDAFTESETEAMEKERRQRASGKGTKGGHARHKTPVKNSRQKR